MTSIADDWLEDAFLAEGEPESVDGGTTNIGPLWHAVSPRWGHSMHTMCSYHGMFPPKLAHYFVQRFSQPGDLVVDPFSGRGTTVLQARVEERRVVGNDLSPLAYVLSRAKVAPPKWAALMRAIDQMERAYRMKHIDLDVHEDIKMLYHPTTLSQLVYLRSHLLRRAMSKWSQEEFMIAGATAGILHGAHRRDGTSQYLSISMPNTFSMSPTYVRNFIREKGLTQPEQNVFDCLRTKMARLYLDGLPGDVGVVTNVDANAHLRGRGLSADSVDLLLTSPPYLDVVNYGTSNWIRLWWLGVEDVARDSGAGRRRLDAKLDHRHNYASYADFMRRTFEGTRRVLKPSGVAVFVIGDVTVPGGESRSLATEIWEDVGTGTGLRLLTMIEDDLDSQNKVSRIWGDTKGNATNRDCILVLARDEGEPATDLVEFDWNEPYRDAGPDAAHARLREAGRRAS